MKSNKCIKIGMVLFVFILISHITAFGVGSIYHKDKPLKISAGESKEIIFNFQNPIGNDITTRPIITEGSEIIQFIDSSDFLVPVGSSIDFIAKVVIPNDVEAGTTIPVELTFTTVESKVDGQTLGFGSSVGRNFDVIIVPTDEELALLSLEEERGLKAYGNWAIFIGIVILVLIIAILNMVNKKKKSGNLNNKNKIKKNKNLDKEKNNKLSKEKK